MSRVSGNDPSVPSQQPQPPRPEHPDHCLCTIKHTTPPQRINNPICKVHNP